MKVALFATCVIDQMFPDVAEATANVLRRYGCEVSFPRAQVCCAQPAMNSGYVDDARRVAAALLDALEGAEYVVTPSGSCAAMIHHHYAGLFEGDAARLGQVEQLCARLFELSQFLVNVLGLDELDGAFPHAVTFHPSCHASRLLGVREEPLTLLRKVPELSLLPLPNAQDCCGFGGTFSVKLPEISAAIADEKLSHVQSTGARYLVSTDQGCLMHLSGRMQRCGMDVQALHLAELLDLAADANAGPG